MAFPYGLRALNHGDYRRFYFSQFAAQIVDQGQIVEMNAPAEFFSNPQHERTKLFLSQILH